MNLMRGDDYDDAVSGTSTKDTSSHAALDELHSRHLKRDNYDANREIFVFPAKKFHSSTEKSAGLLSSLPRLPVHLFQAQKPPTNSRDAQDREPYNSWQVPRMAKLTGAVHEDGY